MHLNACKPGASEPSCNVAAELTWVAVFGSFALEMPVWMYQCLLQYCSAAHPRIEEPPLAMEVLKARCTQAQELQISFYGLEHSHCNLKDCSFLLEHPVDPALSLWSALLLSPANFSRLDCNNTEPALMQIKGRLEHTWFTQIRRHYLKAASRSHHWKNGAAKR